jgi:hypothetical protein
VREQELEDEVDDWQDADDEGMSGTCDLCDEPWDVNGPPSRSEVGEFVAPDGSHVIAHAQCGLDAEHELA